MGRSEQTPAAEPRERSQSQTVRALLAMRELILEGALAPGARISELSVADRTGISRTPIRTALQRLEEEGLVEGIPSGGFAVRSFSTQDVYDAIEVRGSLEGLAARFAAERGAPPARLEPLHQCLEELDRLTFVEPRSEECFSDYMAANARFHALILDLADSPTLKRQMERAVALPFASPSAFVMAQSMLPESQRILVIAQDQHRCTVDAIANREGARAQALMQEHARVAGRNLRLALRSKDVLELVPGSSLIRHTT